ncbi:MAG TPA: hypothetical protein VLD18_06805, partial [Verrucomicrobiae bacterium]|nr:hypothetical protein [Verrucomicrobiae bacterium]
MNSRSLPVIVALLLALGAIGFLVVRTEKDPRIVPEPPPTTAPALPLSDLATAPDWRLLDRFQDSISRDDFVRQMNEVFTVSPAWRDWFTVNDDHVLIRTVPGEDFRLRFAPGDSMRTPPRLWRWRTIDQLPPAPAGRPLDGVKIAIDPGHIGGRWGKMEERWFQIP